MNLRKHEYADGTYLLARPDGWGGWVGGAAMCDDGKVRILKRIASQPDTMFSIPAAVSAYGTTVTGFVTHETREGYSTPTESDPLIVRFIAYTYRRNWRMMNRHYTHKGTQKASTL
jgi:hypothetical protein